ncbi:hypothetical protein Cni_G14823 [Canna indica]|uniref:Uncharacterized protein n=1 Tax=Canna indica TaxID=4628 RepID=A0AAQ3QE66_9LILI|nr:hypothetical protein Cni_G14823 [Canna indica]
MASSRVFSSRLWTRLSPLLRPAGAPRPSTPLDYRLLLLDLSPSSTPVPPSSPASILLRYFSTTARRRPTRARTVDIGARARQLQTRRLWTYALTFSCIAGFVVVVLSNFEFGFYVTPTKAMKEFMSGPTARRGFRLGGLVLDGSFVEPTSDNPEMEFVVTDLENDILVRYEGSLPDLFREGHSIVIDGFLRPFEESDRAPTSGPAVSEKARSAMCYFKATEVLAKHDEKYMPPEIAEAIAKNQDKLATESQEEAAGQTS